MATSGFERTAPLIIAHSKMKYSLLKPKKRVLQEDKLPKHVKILRELPADVDSRVVNIHRRNEILKANKYHQLKIERDRANSAIATLPLAAQRNLRNLIVQQRNDIREAMLGFARKGGVP